MGNMILATPLADAAAIIAGSETAGMEAANLLAQQPDDVWRAVNLAQAWVELDLGAAMTVNLVSMLYSNATSAATIRVRADATQAGLTGGSPGYDSTALSHWPVSGLETWPWTHSRLWLGAAPKTFHWWRIDIADAANPAGFYQAGRLYLSNAWRPTDNLSYGHGLAHAQRGGRRRSPKNGLFPLPRPNARIETFTLTADDEDEFMANAFEIDRLRGSSGDVLWMFDPDETVHIHRRMIYGLLDDGRPIVKPNAGIFEKQYRLEEML